MLAHPTGAGNRYPTIDHTQPGRERLQAGAADAIMGMILSSVERDLVGKSGGIFISGGTFQPSSCCCGGVGELVRRGKPLTGQLPQVAPPPRTPG